MHKNWGVFIAAIFIVILTECILLCCRKVARNVPGNYILLLIFTLGESYMVSNICSYYSLSQPKVVILAGLGTVLITLACTIYAFTTKTDFTLMGGFMWIMGMTALVLVLFTWVFRWNTFIHNFIIALCILFFGIFLIFDTQMIVGKGKHKLSLDDYVIGALILYVDIITIFVYLLDLLSKR